MNDTADFSLFKINDLVINPRDYTIQRGEETVSVSPRTLDILRCLIDKNGDLVTYEEIINVVWGGDCSENALYKQITTLRKALNDRSSDPKFIKTVSKRGYQFIGKVERISESQVSLDEASKTIKKWVQKPRNLIVGLGICAVFMSMLVGASYYLNSSHARVLEQLLSPKIMPEEVVFLEVYNSDNHGGSNGVSNLLALLMKIHIDLTQDVHVMEVQRNGNAEFYERISSHVDFAKRSSLILRASSSVENERIYLTLSEIRPSVEREEVVINVEGSVRELSRLFSSYELELIDYLNRKDILTSKELLMSASDAGTKLLVEAADNYYNKTHTFNGLKDSVKNAKRAIDLDKKNVVAYSVLFENIYRLIIRDMANIDVNMVLKELSVYGEELVELKPSYYRGHHALAEYNCLIQKRESCIKHLKETVELNPYAPRALNQIIWESTRLKINPIDLGAYNYKLNPLHQRAADFYRSTLIGDRNFYGVSEFSEDYAQWESDSSAWYFSAQSFTGHDDLIKASQLYGDYLTHTNEKGESQHKGVAQFTSHYAYAAYTFLSANQPDLAGEWIKNHWEQAPPYFDLRSIPLLIDLWEGKWERMKWESIRVFAMDREDFLNNMDKFVISYYDLISENHSTSAKYILEVFPELGRKGFEIDRNNVRHAVYLSEINKRFGNFDVASRLSAAIENFLVDNKYPLHRNGYSGVIDAEFYALNNRPEQAIEALSNAVDDGWMPNAYWIWPPLDKNRFLVSLRSNEQFKALSDSVNMRVSSICFSAPCQSSVGEANRIVVNE